MGSTTKESGFDSRKVKENFLRTIQIGSGAHPASSPGGTASFLVPEVRAKSAVMTTDFNVQPRLKIMELNLHLSYVFMAWFLIKHRGNLTFTFYLCLSVANGM
jgi:hypothetical protein